MKVGKLIHTITFYTTKYIDNGNGTGSNELIELRKVKCSIEDITYKDIQEGKRKDIERTLKVHTHYFKEFDTKGMKAKINEALSDSNETETKSQAPDKRSLSGIASEALSDSNEDNIYEVIYRENVSYKNTECIFTIKKLVNNKKSNNRE